MPDHRSYDIVGASHRWKGKAESIAQETFRHRPNRECNRLHSAHASEVGFVELVFDATYAVHLIPICPPSSIIEKRISIVWDEALSNSSRWRVT